MMQTLSAWRRSADRLVPRATGIALCLAAGLAFACSGGTGDVEKAQIAVRANPALELVATDERQAVLTVKVKRSGRVITVSAADVIAGTAFRDLDAEPAGGQLTVQRNAPSTPRVDATTSGGTASANESGVGASAPGGQVSIRGGGSGIAVSGAGGQVKLGGGAVVTQSNPGRREAATPERSSSSSPSAAPSSDGRGAVIDENRLEQRSRPVACTGDNNVTLSNVLLRVDGVAITGVGSCDIRIRNSHIIGDTAVQVTGSTNVAIENSIIEGRVALSLTGSADMSVKSSTIRGSVQRVGPTQLKDLGGNVWP